MFLYKNQQTTDNGQQTTDIWICNHDFKKIIFKQTIAIKYCFNYICNRFNYCMYVSKVTFGKS